MTSVRRGEIAGSVQPGLSGLWSFLLPAVGAQSCLGDWEIRDRLDRAADAECADLNSMARQPLIVGSLGNGPPICVTPEDEWLHATR